MKKKQLFFLVLSGAIVFQTAGCTQINNISKPQGEASGAQTADEQAKTGTQVKAEKLPLAQIRKQAQNLDISYPNLDLSNAKALIPDVDEVYDLTFPMSAGSFEENVKKLEENIRKYKGLGKDVNVAKYMTLMYWDVAENETLEVPLEKAGEQQKNAAQYLYYNDGECAESFVFANHMFEMGDYSVCTRLTGSHSDYSGFSCRDYGREQGLLYERYDLAKDDISGISYHLSDGDMAISDAVAFVEKHMKEDYYFVGSKHLDYRVLEVTVRKLGENTYYYEFDIGTSFKGMPLNSDDCFYQPGYLESGNETLAAEPFGTNSFVSMFQKGRIGYIWSCRQSFEVANVNQTYQELLPLEEACRLLSNYLSENKSYEMSSVELVYQTEEEYENDAKASGGSIQSVHANPAYHFSVAKTGIAQYQGCMYFDVDAVNGEITEMVN